MARGESKSKTITNNYEVHNSDNSASAVQVTVGTKFHFVITDQKSANAFCTTETFEQNGNTIEFDQLHTDDGDTLALSQVIRRRNGIELDGYTNQERFDSFFSMVKDAKEDGITLKVADVVNAVFGVTNAEGVQEERKSRQFVFEIL